ncbi:MAG TPA: caspase family protein [Malonomonas sp.]
MKRLGYLLAFGLLLGCQPQQGPMGMDALSSSQADSLARSAEDLMLVDCLIPGQMRKIGRQVTYLTARRPMKTTAIDCEIRGGEYVVADLADYRSALKVWQEKADQNDVLAQIYVGEIYEKGLGTRPNYQLAAEWYRRAAEQGSSRAQINLAHLYEQGLGVKQDKLAALTLYRKAGGLPGELNLDGAAADQLLLEEMNGLRKELQRRTQELDQLREQLRQKPSPTEKPQESVAKTTYQREISQLEQHVRQLQQLVTQKDQQLSTLAKNRAQETPVKAPATIPPIEFGRYYALIIGNNRYDNQDDLQTAINDARELGRLLQNNYGFHVKVLENAKHLEILTELNKYRKNLSEKDNFLLYFAGHGKFNARNNRGFWLPSDAYRDNEANWISNTTITDYLNDMPARRVLVVADSCYSGIMASSAVPALRGGRSEELRIDWLKSVASKRSRTVLTSGGLEPVLDVGGGGHSLFAKIFLNVLQDNRGLLEAQNLYIEVAPAVSSAAQVAGVPQEPQYAPIHFAGHGGGEFFFVPSVTAAADTHERTNGGGFLALSRPDNFPR